MLKTATIICPRCKKADDMTVKEGQPFPNKCDVCGSTNLMLTHVKTNIREPDEIDEAKKVKAKIAKASRAAAEAFAKANA